MQTVRYTCSLAPAPRATPPITKMQDASVVRPSPAYAIYKTSLGKRVYNTAELDLLPIRGISPADEVQNEATHRPWTMVTKDRKKTDWNYDVGLHLSLGLCVHSRIEVHREGQMIRGFRGDDLAPEGIKLYASPVSPSGWFHDGGHIQRRALVAALNAACDWCEMERGTDTMRFICRKCAGGYKTISSDGICHDCRSLPSNTLPCEGRSCPRCGLLCNKLYTTIGKSRSFDGCNRCRLLQGYWIKTSTGEIPDSDMDRAPNNRYANQEQILSEDFKDTIPLEVIEID